MKDPAFLFYSKDFYEGTRMMLPEERGCYIDLMIYQHQNGIIPADLRRVLMYCSGVDEATLKAVLEAKFKRCDRGWYNERLAKETEAREEYAKKQSQNGTIGQFWKKAKAILSKKEYTNLRNSFSNVQPNELFDIINEYYSGAYSDAKAMLQAMLEHRAFANEDANKDKDKIKVRKIPEFIDEEFMPVISDWLEYKKARGEPYKTEQSLKAFQTKLKNLSGGDIVIARRITEESMANNWQGIFPLKTERNEATNRRTVKAVPGAAQGESTL